MSSEEDSEYKGEGIQADEQVEDTIDEGTADSGATLQSDEADAADKSNIIKERTRGAEPAAGSYAEPDEDSIGEDSEGNAVRND
ncbi:hypothetical protein BDY17DRAFT_323415 [Neohortaea acidophila]|uniref:Histone chaperone domain-containing protein n=1 Tax=Neohortaea acidophila TaxID=245834 RepID=A0A6A6PX08_9PEZI|nr:uncharacterized protein BDY17DRAFT_323415 [Neohortaea acidophila]KAF2484572.1 hypothetical protein BDY17DRAFT_323415 [Neohortaea acidophila]